MMTLNRFLFCFLMMRLGAADPFCPAGSCSNTAPTTFKKVPTNNSEQSVLPSILAMRGGEVFEPTTLEDVNDILMRASAEGKLVVIDFSATWCGPCKMIAPIFKELSEEFENVIFLKIDVDENQDTAMKYEVNAMPTFIFIKKGEVIDKVMGANAPLLKEMLEDLS